MRVFVAASPDEWLPARVLEFSIRENSSAEASVETLQSFGKPIPVPLLPRNRPRTPFSFQRFLIPEICGFQGRAIYLDADMLVFRDLQQVWDMPMHGCDLLTVAQGGTTRAGQFSVMLLDCARLDWRIERIVAGLDEGRYSYEELMQRMCVARRVGRTIPAAWNDLEHFDAGSTCLLHYTDMPMQPWVRAGHPLGGLWLGCLGRALAAGFVTRAEIEREQALGRVRPSLAVELRDGVLSAADADRLDAAFEPPYLRLAHVRPGLARVRAGIDVRVRGWLGRLRALARG